MLEIFEVRLCMKRAILMSLAFLLAAGGIAVAQNECDDLYIKAMQANSPAERVQFLKDFLVKCSGKGSQYENFANAFLCTAQVKKPDQETIAYGEKALALGGLDDALKTQVLMQLAVVFNKPGQNAEKAKSHANQLIQAATAAKAKDPSNANWNTMIGVGHFIVGQTLEKNKDYKGAVEAYTTSYGILKDGKILVEMKKIANSLYEAKNYAEAERIYRMILQVNPKDVDSPSRIALCLYKSGKVDEALAMWKDSFAKSKSGEMAYNIGITLAKEAKTTPALTGDAIRFLIDAALLSPKFKDALGMAESLFFGSDKEWNNRVKSMQESKQLIDEWAKTINTKFGEKSEDDLTSDERREYRILKGNIDKEQKILDDLQTKQKAGIDGFNKIMAEEKQKLTRR